MYVGVINSNSKWETREPSINSSQIRHSFMHEYPWETYLFFPQAMGKWKDRLGSIDSFSSQSYRRKTLNSKNPGKGWATSGYLVQDIPLQLGQCIWCPHDPNGLQDSWLLSTVNNSNKTKRKLRIYFKFLISRLLGNFQYKHYFNTRKSKNML